MSTLREQAAQAQSIGERQLLLAAKLNEAADIADQVGGIATVTAVKSTAVKSAKRGRPAGSKNSSPTKKSPKAKKAVAKKAAVASKKDVASKKAGRGRRNGPKSMKEMVVSILKGRKKGLILPDIVQHIMDSGYETKSKDVVNVVYQAVYKLMKDEGITDDQRVEKDGKNYRLTAAAAA